MPDSGLYRGVVVNASDPARQRRLLVEVPGLDGLGQQWALPCVPAGSRAMPRVGSTVWLAFEKEQGGALVWLGTLPHPQ
jgi:hypothetical protein